MGNYNSSKLKLLYGNSQLEYIETNYIEYVGNFNVFRDPFVTSEMLMVVYFNPSEFDQTFEIQNFVKTMTNMPDHVCRFYLCEKSAKNKSIMDIIFEYGITVEKFGFEKKELELFLFEILNSLIFLESQRFTYSSISKSTFVISEKKLKLLNPFCFKNFLKDVLNIYMNPMK